MNNITEIIRQRRSVRTYDGRKLSQKDKNSLCAFAENAKNPFGIPVKFKLMTADENGLTCPVVTGTDLYIGGKIKCTPNASTAFGYSFEMLVLYAQSLGIGTVWLGGTMNRSAFEQAMELEADEMMPCASALGYPAKKLSLRESMMRKAIKADERLPFEELFFDGNFDTPLTRDKAGIFAEPLEMVRLSPSAVNKQPWRAAVSGNTVHFYLKRKKAPLNESGLDMQKVDMGIALCHFVLTAEKNNLNAALVQADPQIISSPELEYIASCSLT